MVDVSFARNNVIVTVIAKNYQRSIDIPFLGLPFAVLCYFSAYYANA